MYSVIDPVEVIAVDADPDESHGNYAHGIQLVQMVYHKISLPLFGMIVLLLGGCAKYTELPEHLTAHHVKYDI